jgi:hypothetical protein
VFGVIIKEKPANAGIVKFYNSPKIVLLKGFDYYFYLMNKIIYNLILGFLLISSSATFAQEKKLEIDFKSKGSLNSYDTYSFVNKERNRVCILAIGKTTIKGYILNQDYVLLKEFEEAKPDSREVLVGGYFKEDKIHYLLARDEDDDNMKHFTYDPVTGTSTKVFVNLEIKKSMFLGGLSLGDQFLFVSVKKKEDKIMVYRFGKNDSHEVLTFDYPASLMKQQSLHAALSNDYGFSRMSELSYINDWESPSIERIKNYCKMYYRNDSLIITHDKSATKTRVLELDLQTQKIAGREIKRVFDECSDVMGPTFVKQNTFLLDNYLYSVVCCSDALQLNVYNFYSGEIVKQYTTDKKEEISFKSTDILQEGSAYFSKGERKLEKTRQLLRKMTNGRAIIMAKNANGGTVELTIGSFQEVRSGGGGMWIGGATPGSVPIYVPTGGFSREWTKSARFKTLLDKDSFEKTGGEVEKPLEERIEDFTKDIKIPGGCEGVYPVDNKLAYYYIDRNANKLVVAAL